MPLYSLKVKEETIDDKELEDGWCYFDAKVIRATSEAKARKFANLKFDQEGKIWEDEDLVSCELIDPNGPTIVVLESYIDA